jgi:DNA-binding CsgD family transcriptional regulator
MYGEEIRRKVIDLLESGKTQQAVGDFLRINPRTIRNWM